MERKRAINNDANLALEIGWTSRDATTKKVNASGRARLEENIKNSALPMLNLRSK